MHITIRLTRQENAGYFGVRVGDTVSVPLEEYVAGVVASEVGNPHIEAAKAQAVAARTHAWPYYSTGKTISDSSATNQAFRAVRINPKSYPNAVKAAQETRGEVLFYNGKVISTCAYSASNGGQTTSSEERWGGFRAWLIAQPDPWDVAEGITTKTGHGVGMSQRGMKYAAKIGKTYKEILSFYYPHTVVGSDSGKVEESDTMNEKAAAVVVAAKSQMGYPYVFGAWGSTCTPSVRKQCISYNPDHEAAIKKSCQVLNGSSVSCEGCKWNGARCFDCRGFTYWCLHEVGIKIEGGGATSQYNNTANWVARGEIKNMPDCVCCVFKYKDGKMQHTGLHIGGGHIIHCSAGVQEGKTSDRGWTHYAIPVGLYTTEEIAEMKIVISLPTLRMGDKGENVKVLQESLNKLRYDCGNADGVFGANTSAALRCFQSDSGIVIDAICGEKTWAALTAALEKDNPQEQPEQEPPVIMPVEDHDTKQLVLLQIDVLQSELDKMRMLIGGV